MAENFELLPPEGDPNVGLKVFEILGEVVADKTAQGLHSLWYDRYRLSRNMPFKQDKKKVPLLSANLLHTHRQRTVNTLTDNSPTFNLAKVGFDGNSDEEKFSNLQRTAEHWWREEEQQAEFASSVNNGEMNGCAIEKISFNSELEQGKGEVETIIVDPYHFGFYPVDARKPHRADANLHFYPMSVREAKRTWPDKADKIKPDSDVLKEIGDNRRQIGGEKTTTDSKVSGVFSSIMKMFASTEQDDTSDQVLVCEMWVRDRSKNEDGTPKYTGFIRRVTVCSGGEVVLEDKDNPSISKALDPEIAKMTYLYDRFPFIMVPSIEDPCSAWGQSDWEQLSDLQKEFAKTLSQFGYFKDKAVRPKILNPRDSGIDNSEFNNAYGVLNPTSANMSAGVKYLEMNNTGLMAEIQGSINLIKDLFFMVSGTFELEQAQTGQVTAYKAIAALLEHAATMMRGKIRNYQRLIRERGRMYLSHVQNFYTEDRWISYEEEGETVPAKIRGTQMIVPAKLTVVSGSTLPRAELQRREEGIELFNKGAIDQTELLRVLDWPNRSEVLRRMKEGPTGELVARLQVAGFPQEILQFIAELAQMDSKEFEKAAKSGEIPQLDLPEQTIDPLENLKFIIQSSEARQAEAEAALAEEKVVTERVEQQKTLAGIQFDAQSLEMERGKILDDFVSKQRNRPGYNERGMQSNNEN